jgi:GNAT superfamily N-acetyltransferase
VSETDLVIEVVYVEPSSRNVGLGERLVLDAVGFAKSTGRSRVLGRALPGDRETKNLFERTGLVSQVIVVGKQID